MSKRGDERGSLSWLRIVGVALAVGLLWVAFRNVPWKDSFRVGKERFSGTLVGEFQEAPVRFRFDADQAPEPGSPLAGHAAASAAALGGEVLLWSDRLESAPWVAEPGGEPRAAGAPETLELAPPLVLEWRPGMPRLFSEIRVTVLAQALAFLFVSSLLIVTRWWRLLALIGCPTRWKRALRLTYVGLFFNIALPGVNGGDLARAVLVVRRHPDRRADALSSVLVDRILGLVAMALVATVAILINDDRLATLRVPVVLAFGGMVVGLAAFLNKRLRHWTRFDALLARLPQGRRLTSLDRAVREYAKHPGEILVALALSAGNHLCNAAAAMIVGRAFGADFSFLDYICVVCVANTLSAVPLSPGGLGVAEVAFGSLFELLQKGAYMLGVASSLTYRLCMWSLGLVGGLVMLLPGGREAREQFAEQRSGESPARDPEDRDESAGGDAEERADPNAEKSAVRPRPREPERNREN